MPIYAYRCQECEHEVEALQRISDPVLTTCPTCNKETLVKCVTAARVRLKGKGYYETDEKPKSKQRHIAKSDSDESKGSSSAGGKSSSKSADSKSTKTSSSSTNSTPASGA